VRPQLIRFITYDQVKDLVLTLRSHTKIENLLPPPPMLPGAPTEPASAPPLSANNMIVPEPGSPASAGVNGAFIP